MKKEFEKEQKDNHIDDAFLDMPDMDDDEKFSQWLEDEYLKEADAIEDSLLAGRKFEDNQDVAEKLNVSRENFYQRLREEGILEEDPLEKSAGDSSEEENSSENSDEDSEKPAVEETEKKVREFRRGSETSKKDSDSTEKVVSIEKKSSAKKKHSYVRFGRIAGIAGLCLICVFAASMSSEANRKYLVNSVRILSGNDSQLLVDNSESNEHASMEESDAIADIEEKLDVKMPEFYYRPYGLTFSKYKLKVNTCVAYIKYNLNDTSILFYIDKQQESGASNISSINGKERVVDIMSETWGDIVIKEMLDEKDKYSTYSANWIYENVFYSITGKLELRELKKMIEYMKF